MQKILKKDIIPAKDSVKNASGKLSKIVQDIGNSETTPEQVKEIVQQVEIDTDFIRMQKEAKCRGLNALSERINTISEIIDKLSMLNDAHMKRQKALWTKNKSHEIEVNKWLIDKIVKLSKDVFNMDQAKVMIQMTPTADINLQEEINKMLTKARK